MGGRTSRRLAWCLAPAIAALAMPAAAQAPPAAKAKGTVHITTADIDLHAGPTGSYYRWGKLKPGQAVNVLEIKNRWAKVQTVGPAFGHLYGYMRLLVNDNGRVRMEDGGRTLVTLGKIDILAPNMNEGGAADASWAWLDRLGANARVTVLEDETTDRERILKVALPTTGVGWVNIGQLRVATAAEARPLQTILAGGTPAAGRVPPLTNPARGSRPLGRPESSPPPVTTPSGTDDSTRVPALGAGTTQGRSTGGAAPINDSATDTLPNAPGEVPSTVPMTPREPSDMEKRISALEAAFEALRSEPIETAELTPLIGLYMDLARDTADRPSIRDFALNRADQLEIWEDVQTRRQELAALRARLRENSAEADSIRLSLERSSDYVAVGRIAASTIYDGKSLPQLYRIQDPSSGRTVGYIRATKDFDLVGLLGQLIGIVGTADYDGGLRVNVVTAERIDLLAPENRPSRTEKADADDAGDSESEVAEPRAATDEAAEI